jgi:hypothetical protein
MEKGTPTIEPATEATSVLAERIYARFATSLGVRVYALACNIFAVLREGYLLIM